MAVYETGGVEMFDVDMGCATSVMRPETDVADDRKNREAYAKCMEHVSEMIRRFAALDKDKTNR